MTQKPSSYYGPFFWLAVVSFLVPLVVAARAFYEVRLATRPTPAPDASGVDHALWDDLLKTYVENGLVDYDGLSRDYLFRTYLRQLSAADPSKLETTSQKLALHCNAYNAFVINGVIVHKISDSVRPFEVEGVNFFDLKEHIYCGRTISLNHLEHELIRSRFSEPRIHMALVCAAKSCPPIRPEAYLGKQLDEQLEDQAVQFANHPKYVAYDSQSQTLLLSQILNWYGSDWDHLGGYLPWLQRRAKDPTLAEALGRAQRKEIPIAFADYDWSLNAQTSSGQTAAPQPSGEFGSGSVPNQ